VKLKEPRNAIILGPTASRCRKATVSDRTMARSLESQAGSIGTVCLEKDMSGTREIQQGLGFEYANRMKLTLRDANALLEVGPTGSTLSTGKPCTWGSGGAVEDLLRDTSAALRGGLR